MTDAELNEFCDAVDRLVDWRKYAYPDDMKTVVDMLPAVRALLRAPTAEEVELQDLQNENERLQKWVHDLQSGMFINCVYCGHRYGPTDDVPDTMADVLKRHVEQCPEHPMSALKKELARLRAEAPRWIPVTEDRIPKSDDGKAVWCLVYCESERGPYFTDAFFNGSWGTFGEHRKKGRVTAWMKMPGLPPLPSPDGEENK